MRAIIITYLTIVIFTQHIYATDATSCSEEITESAPSPDSTMTTSNSTTSNGFDTFRLMTYNIRFATVLDLQYAWTFRKQIVSTLIKDRADIACLQEALHSQIEDLKEALKDYKHIGVGRDDGKTQGEYVAIFYNHRKFKVLDKGHFWLSQTPSVAGSKSWDSKYPRMCTWALFSLKEHEGQSPNSKLPSFYIFNTHLDHLSNEARIEGTKLILRTIQEKASQNIPIFFVGDLNSELDSEVYQLITKGQDSFTMKDTTQISLTGHHGSIATSTGFKFHEAKIIDYIFVHHGNENCVVMTHGVLDDVWPNNYAPSDHRPVVCDILMKW